MVPYKSFLWSWAAALFLCLFFLGSANAIPVQDNESGVWQDDYDDAIGIADVVSKKTRTTPRAVIDRCKARFRTYDDT